MQVITYKGYSFLRTQTPHVHPISFSFHRQPATKPSFQQLDIVLLSSPALLSYLQERGINTALAKRECREAHFTNNGKRYFAIAFPNISGRYEIRNRYFKGCIAPKEISHIRQSGEPRKACYVFEGFMDYLSFLTLRLENCPQSPDFNRQDYMVLNSVGNVSKALYAMSASTASLTMTVQEWKPCNIASSEAHNRRAAEYMRHIGESRIYVVPELSTDNEQ